MADFISCRRSITFPISTDVCCAVGSYLVTIDCEFCESLENNELLKQINIREEINKDLYLMFYTTEKFVKQN